MELDTPTSEPLRGNFVLLRADDLRLLSNDEASSCRETRKILLHLSPKRCNLRC